MGSSRTKRKGNPQPPMFDDVALSQLTKQIDKSLPTQDLPAKRKRSQGSDDTATTQALQDRPERPKRPRRGQEPDGGPAKATGNQVLLDEIRALGGDEDDYDLVANLDSDNEEGQTPVPKLPQDAAMDESLKRELAKFASSLGFQNLPAEDEVDTDAGEESEAEPQEKDRNGKGEKELALPEKLAPKSSGKLIFEPRSDWYGIDVSNLPSAPAGQEGVGRFSALLDSLKAYADALLEQDSTAYSTLQLSRSTRKFMSTIMTSGTLSDRVSALTLSIQESPLHSRKAFESLITLAGKKSRGQAIAALGALVDLLGNGAILPDDRRLRPFNQQPALLASLFDSGTRTWAQGQPLPGRISRLHLMMWAYEDWLKAAFFRIIQLLEVWCSDEIEYSRSRALDFIYGLLRSKPEQEANLLRLVVNKLGDRERKIASRASYLILQLLNTHPGMKEVVVRAVEQDVLLKPGQTLRAKYYAINTLNQTILSTKESVVADTLLRIYFELFLALLKTGSLGSLGAPNGEKEAGGGSSKRGKRKNNDATTGNQDQDTTQKLVSSLLTGVNRAVPFTASDDTTLEKHLDTLFRITHSSNFNTSVQALMLIQQLAASKQLAVDRFYRTLYESLLDPRLATSSKQALYLNLLFRAMKNDVDVRRVKAFVKRLLQILGLHQPSFACGILFLVAELGNSFPDLHTLLEVPEDDGDEEEEVYRDVVDENTTDNTPPQPEKDAEGGRSSMYDGRKRNPEHSNAHRSCLWEIIPFLNHFHPTVSVFAANLIERQKNLPKPDLANHTLMHFLDKFVYRNPKASETKRGSSIMQPVLASSNASHVVVSSKASARQQPAVNSASFWKLKPEDVSAEDAFFHEYFARVGKQNEKPKKASKKADQAGSDDEEGEQEIWDALVNSRPEVEGGDSGDESDIEMEGYVDSDEDVEADTEVMSDIGSDDSGGFEGIFEDSDGDDALESASEDNGSSDDQAEDDGAAQGDDRKKRLSRSEMRRLPMFASADDYAEMLAAEEDGM